MSFSGYDPGDRNNWYQSPQLSLFPVSTAEYGGGICGACSLTHLISGACSLTHSSHPPPPFPFQPSYSPPPPPHSQTIINGYVFPHQFPCVSQTHAQFSPPPHLQPIYPTAQQPVTTTPQSPSIPHSNPNPWIYPPISQSHSCDPHSQFVSTKPMTTTTIYHSAPSPPVCEKPHSPPQGSGKLQVHKQHTEAKLCEMRESLKSSMDTFISEFREELRLLRGSLRSPTSQVDNPLTFGSPPRSSTPKFIPAPIEASSSLIPADNGIIRETPVDSGLNLSHTDVISGFNDNTTINHVVGFVCGAKLNGIDEKLDTGEGENSDKMVEVNSGDGREFNELEGVTSGAIPVSVKKGIDKTVQALVDELENKSRLVKGRDDVKAVASVSVGMDEQFGTMIVAAIDKAGQKAKKKQVEDIIAVGMTVKLNNVSNSMGSNTGNREPEIQSTEGVSSVMWKNNAQSHHFQHTNFGNGSSVGNLLLYSEVHTSMKVGNGFLNDNFGEENVSVEDSFGKMQMNSKRVLVKILEKWKSKATSEITGKENAIHSVVARINSQGPSPVLSEDNQSFASGSGIFSSSVLDDKLIRVPVNGLARASGSEQTLEFVKNLNRVYSTTLQKQPKSEGAETSRNNEPINGFLNDSQPTADSMSEFIWRNGGQNIQHSGLADTSSVLMKSCGSYLNFDMLSGKGEKLNFVLKEGLKLDNEMVICYADAQSGAKLWQWPILCLQLCRWEIKTSFLFYREAFDQMGEMSQTTLSQNGPALVGKDELKGAVAIIDWFRCAILEFDTVATLNAWLSGNFLFLPLENMSLLLGDKWEKMDKIVKMMFVDNWERWKYLVIAANKNGTKELHMNFFENHLEPHGKCSGYAMLDVIVAVPTLDVLHIMHKLGFKPNYHNFLPLFSPYVSVFVVREVFTSLKLLQNEYQYDSVDVKVVVASAIIQLHLIGATELYRGMDNLVRAFGICVSSNHLANHHSSNGPQVLIKQIVDIEFGVDMFEATMVHWLANYDAGLNWQGAKETSTWFIKMLGFHHFSTNKVLQQHTCLQHLQLVLRKLIQAETQVSTSNLCQSHSDSSHLVWPFSVVESEFLVEIPKAQALYVYNMKVLMIICEDYLSTMSKSPKDNILTGDTELLEVCTIFISSLVLVGTHDQLFSYYKSRITKFLRELAQVLDIKGQVKNVDYQVNLPQEKIYISCMVDFLLVLTSSFGSLNLQLDAKRVKTSQHSPTFYSIVEIHVKNLKVPATNSTYFTLCLMKIYEGGYIHGSVTKTKEKQLKAMGIDTSLGIDLDDEAGRLAKVLTDIDQASQAWLFAWMTFSLATFLILGALLISVIHAMSTIAASFVQLGIEVDWYINDQPLTGIAKITGMSHRIPQYNVTCGSWKTFQA